MKLTPLDILQRRFTKRWRGVDPDEVKDFLEVISAELEEIIRENRFLEEELKKSHQSLAAYRQREDTLKETMITAQKVTQDMKENVKREAELLIAQAKLDAERIVGEARRRSGELQDELAALKRQKIRFESELKGLIETHLKILDAVKDKKEDEFEASNVKYLTPTD